MGELKPKVEEQRGVPNPGRTPGYPPVAQLREFRRYLPSWALHYLALGLPAGTATRL